MKQERCRAKEILIIISNKVINYPSSTRSESGWWRGSVFPRQEGRKSAKGPRADMEERDLFGEKD